MGQLLIGGTVLSILLTTFISSFQWSGWTKGYLGLYSGCIEASISNVLPYRPEGGPHFDSTLLKANVAIYVRDNMEPYSKSTTYTIALSKKDSQGEFLEATLTFDADLGFTNLHKSVTFTIVEADS